ncbi:hypothetical protein MNV49_005389 [Pseudohyphozyma bogoriensis]|nr:hypothetical protein MNV49_005389 [Pseudohyphozyma bogoriensis]
MATDYSHFGSLRGGEAVVATAGTLSAFLTAALLLFAAVVLFIHFRQPRFHQLQNESSASRFLSSDFGLLLFPLLVANFLQSLGSAMSYKWFMRDGLPYTPTQLCTTQGVLLHIGELGSCFASFLIAVHIFVVLLFAFKPHRAYLISSIVFLSAVLAVMVALGPLYFEQPGYPFYASGGLSCTISDHYHFQRLYLHHLWVFIVAVLDFVGCIVLCIVLYHRRGQNLEAQIGTATFSLARVQLAYPASYFITILPACLYRLAALCGDKWPLQYAVFASTVLSLSGTVNTIMYSLTRKLVTVEVFQNIRRASQLSDTFTFGTSTSGAKEKRDSGGFGGHYQGGSGRILSFASTLITLVLSFKVLFCYRKKTPYERQEDDTPFTRFLTSTIGILFLSLMFSEVIQGLGYALAWNWVRYSAIPPPTMSNGTCYAQAIMIQVGDTASAVSSLLMGILLFSIFVVRYKPTTAIVVAALVIGWIGVAILATIPFKIQQPGIPLYGNAGHWCWITSSYQMERLTLHFLYIYISAGANLIMYIGIVWRLLGNRKTLGGLTVSDSASVSVARTMLAFPFIYIVCV